MLADKDVFPRATRTMGWQRLIRLVAALVLACLVLFGLLAAMGAFRPGPAAAAGPLFLAPDMQGPAPLWDIAKTAEPDPVTPGGTLTYTITITNIGNLDSSGFYTVTDTLPEYTEFADADPEATLIGRDVRWVQDSPVISNGGSTSFSLVVTVTRPLTDGTPIVNNTYGVSGGGAVEDAAGGPITVTVSAPANLAISKTAEPSPVQPGDVLTYTLTITNDADGPALGVVISDTLSPDVDFLSMDFGDGLSGIFTATPPLLQWELAEPLSFNGVAQVTATVRVSSPLAAPAVLTNTYSVTATNQPALISGSLETPFEATNIITLSKSVTPETVLPGGLVTYTIHLTNTGNGIAQVSLTDLLAEGFDPPEVVTGATVPGRDLEGAPGVASVAFTATVPTEVGVYHNPVVTASYDLDGEAVIEQTAPVTVTAPVVDFSSADYTVNEDAGRAVITVTLSTSSTAESRVRYRTEDITATGGSDYQEVDDVLIFPAGSQALTFTVPITDDLLFELDETVRLVLYEPTLLTLGDTNNPAILTIIDDDPTQMPLVGFDPADYTVDEAVGQAVITVTLSVESGVTATVEYGTVSQTALAGLDYLASTGVLTFSPGEISQTFSVDIIDDDLYEPEETLGLTLTNAISAGIETETGTGTLTIIDNDTAPDIGFSLADYSVGEGDGEAVITVTLSAVSGVTATVAYSTTDGTATGDSDYSPVSDVLTFTPGITSLTFTVPITDDDLYEANETVQLSLADATDANIVTDTATLTIVDNDLTAQPDIGFSLADYSVGEGDGPAVITVTLSAVSGVTATVAYSTTDGSATEDDYTPVTGVLTFSPGELTQTFPVEINDDDLYEANETVQLSLADATDANIVTDTATLTIVDDDPTAQPDVGFSLADYSVGEGDGEAVITVTLSAVSGVTATVAYSTTDGTATGDSDYTPVSDVLIFTPGITSLTFTVPITDDGLYETNETVQLSLDNAVNASLGLTSSAILTIIDDDSPPEVSFSLADYNVGEGEGPAVITVTLSAVSGVTATVVYSTTDGSATEDDYTPVTGVLTFSPGELTQTFPVVITDDDLVENDETVELELRDPVETELAEPSTATLTILDDDEPSVAFSSASYSVAEDAGTATITVTLSAAFNRTASVSYRTDDGTATAGDDYTAVSDVLTFTPGITSLTFSVPITDDNQFESDETVLLFLEDPISASLGSPISATLTIIDDDSPPEVNFSSASYSVDEADGPAVITVTLSAASSVTASVSYRTADGTAVAGSDYTAASGSLVFNPGQITRTFEVTITDDSIYEPDETVLLVLENPISATLGATNPATLTIINDDLTLPEVNFSSANYTVDEGAGTAVITVTLSEVSGIAATVNYSTEDGSAVAGSDYTAASGVLTFAPGSLAQTFSVPVIDDAIQENPETVILRLSSPGEATLGATNPATLTIIDNDLPAINFSQDVYSVGEGDGAAVITVTLSAIPLGEVSVAYSSSDGTATAGTDYTPVSGVLTFTGGITWQTFSVPILDDDQGEPDETVLLALSNPSNGRLGRLSSAELTIVDNDLFELYLPLVMREAADSPPEPGPPPEPEPLSDLRPMQLIVEPAAGLEATTPVVFQVVVQNVGQGAARPNFWVDLYINPSSFPAAAGHVWGDLCGASPCYGLAWQVRQPLGPGESITLRSEPGSLYLDPDQTRWNGAFLRTGVQQLGVYVDSWNGYDKPDGFVLETDETNNLLFRDVEVGGAEVQPGSQGGGATEPVPARPLPE